MQLASVTTESIFGSACSKSTLCRNANWAVPLNWPFAVSMVWWPIDFFVEVVNNSPNFLGVPPTPLLVKQPPTPELYDLRIWSQAAPSWETSSSWKGKSPHKSPFHCFVGVEVGHSSEKMTESQKVLLCPLKPSLVLRGSQAWLPPFHSVRVETSHD